MSADEPATSSSAAIPAMAIPVLSLAAFGSALSLRVTDPLLPRLAQEFGVSIGEAAYVITAFAIAYGFSQLFFGPVGDRFGKYFVIACACVGCAFTALLCALALNYPLLIAARLMAGATAAAIIPLSMAWIGDVVPYSERQPVLAQFLIGQIVGISAGVLLGGLAADHLGWRLPFFCISAYFVAVSLMLFSFNRRLPDYARVTHKAEGSALRRMVNEFGQVLSKPWARVVLLTVFMEGGFLYGAFAFIALHLHRVHHMTLTHAATLVMLFGLGGFLYAVTARKLVKKLGEKKLALWGGILVTASLLTISLAPQWWWAIIGCSVCGLGFYMMHNTLQMNATQMAPERRGAAVSAFASCFYLGQSFGVGAAGMAAERFGTSIVIAIGAVGVLLTAITFSYLKTES
ncbi:MAG TPA: MFS transporter [Oxalicibacterium sp.]|uniref:MFS transporter n=1 Tax=Oxalicibacterium sp. TaxID=2766525 RepID=UPI002CBA7CDD|nr:MFS transporter [Oxalicibacterium sp.]HWU97953.1 MFS transporter [Oxalicibacterium sp.]